MGAEGESKQTDKSMRRIIKGQSSGACGGTDESSTLTAEVIPVKPPTAVFPRHPPISILPVFCSITPFSVFPSSASLSSLSQNSSPSGNGLEVARGLGGDRFEWLKHHVDPKIPTSFGTGLRPDQTSACRFRGGRRWDDDHDGGFFWGGTEEERVDQVGEADEWFGGADRSVVWGTWRELSVYFPFAGTLHSRRIRECELKSKRARSRRVNLTHRDGHWRRARLTGVFVGSLVSAPYQILMVSKLYGRHSLHMTITVSSPTCTNRPSSISPSPSTRRSSTPSVTLRLLVTADVEAQGGADGMLIATDLTTGERLARYSAHFGPLNTIAVTISGGRELVLTGGDDGIARVFDIGMVTKEPVAEFDDGRDCPVTAVEWSADGNQCFVGGVDNEVKVSKPSVSDAGDTDNARCGI